MVLHFTIATCFIYIIRAQPESIVEAVRQTNELFHLDISHYDLQRLVNKINKFGTLSESKTYEKFENFCNEEFAPAEKKTYFNKPDIAAKKEQIL